MRFVMILVMGGMLAVPVMAQDMVPVQPPVAEAAPAEALSMQDVISRQLDAFNARDVDLAWSFASPMIQGLFGSPGNFSAMVGEGYPMVWDNSAAKFIAQREADGRIYQQVLLQGTNGTLHVLEYAMIQGAQGWKIDGVSLLPPPDVGV
jgi:hypothetical protein